MNKYIIIILVFCSILSGCVKDPDSPYLWDKGRIPYKIYGYNSEAIKLFAVAKEYIEKGTNNAVHFEDMTGKDTSDEERILKIIITEAGENNETPCFTKLNNYHPYTNAYLVLGVNTYFCLFFVTHELLHVVGLNIHELQRKDAPIYLSFDWNYILTFPLLVIQQAILPKDPLFYNIKDYEFDYLSATMLPKQTMCDMLNTMPSLYNGSGYPSPIDLKKVKDIYNNADNIVK
jgi:hypothetical protein